MTRYLAVDVAQIVGREAALVERLQQPQGSAQRRYRFDPGVSIDEMQRLERVEGTWRAADEVTDERRARTPRRRDEDALDDGQRSVGVQDDRP